MKTLATTRFVILKTVTLFVLLAGVNQAIGLDFKNGVIVSPPDLSGPERKAITMLVEEVEKRTHVLWSVTNGWPSANIPVIAVGNRSTLKQLAGPYTKELTESKAAGPEGYRIVVKRGAASPAVFVIGDDARGVLFGVGRLLRELKMQPGSATLDDNFEIATSPKYPLRGHQLGYRPKTHSYDAWDLPTWEQYIRDLVVFGCNAIELIPPRSDDDADSPHFPLPPMEMMVGMSRLADSYGLDVWVWYPALDKDYADPKLVEFAVREWGEVFAKLPRLDAVYVPGGDPGHTPPKPLMALLKKQSENLHRYHPKAQMWLSPQGFNQTWMDEFLTDLKREQPTWLNGLVFGPQVRMGLPQLRAAVPKQYPIRHYPDITHTRQSQFPVQDWDVAFAVTEARECINPRPESEAAIFRKTQPDTIGFLTYSEGCNDDVNKAVWSALGWDPEMKVTEILRSYSRYFIGESFTDDFAQGLLALENNWRGPLLANGGVETTLLQFQAMEKIASPFVLKNWRFQQGLFRAYYDAYVRRRLIHETDLEAQAMEYLRTAPQVGSSNAMVAAEKILARTASERVSEDVRIRLHELAAALFQSISMQLSVEKYKAIAVDRGASLDTIDFPLNNRFWLEDRFAKISKLPTEAERLKGVQETLDWTNPGPGGFYDDLGNVARQPHLIQGLSFEEDPGRLNSTRSGFEEDLIFDEPIEAAGLPRRTSWMDHAESLYDTPLRMRYPNLDPKARYKIRILYGGDSPRKKIRLIANEQSEIHPFLTKPFPFAPLEFNIPPAETRSGELTLTWSVEPGLGGNGRGCQLAEVWLIKEPMPAN